MMRFRFAASTILLGLFSITDTSATSLNFCNGANVPLKIPAGAIPLKMNKNLLQSTYATTGWLKILNMSPKSMEEVRIIVRYSEVAVPDAVVVTYFRSTSLEAKSRNSSWRGPLAPGASRQIIGTSPWILNSCPTQGEVEFVEVRYSDGARVVFGDRQTSGNPLPTKLDIKDLNLGPSPASDFAYLMRIKISPHGSVDDVSSADSAPKSPPTNLTSAIKSWKFSPLTDAGANSIREVVAVVRLIRSDCQIETCLFPFTSKDIVGPFLLIDIATPHSATAKGKLEVYVGGSPVDNNGVRYDIE